jgi:hypothetical protein
MSMCEDDEIDDEEIWDSICEVAAKMASISVEKSKEILEDAGFHAHGHTGIVEAVEIVMVAPQRRVRCPNCDKRVAKLLNGRLQEKQWRRSAP